MAIPNAIKIVAMFPFLDTPINAKELDVRRKSAIPDKIAMIAKSMYDRDGLGFGESPQKY